MNIKIINNNTDNSNVINLHVMRQLKRVELNHDISITTSDGEFMGKVIENENKSITLRIDEDNLNFDPMLEEIMKFEYDTIKEIGYYFKSYFDTIE
ncbi:TPA: hypothetical protein NJY08_005108 [Salmonella enterica subsp. enterica serovar Typhi str. AG3]|nr:hypothetical protein [Salmonella enterica subsp. enterica serovar Typhi str. AG3]